MEAILFNFSKRLNSTKRPVDASGVTINVFIKQNVPKGQSSSQSGTETFLSHPTLWVQGDYTEYNYMKFKGRYYFIRDVQFTINNATVIYGEIDVLATYKDDILNTTAFVAYSSSNFSANINDQRIAQEVTKHRNVGTVLSNLFVGSHNAGCYIVNVANDQNGVSSYALDEDDFNYLVCSLMTANDNIISKLDMQFSGAMGGIASARYVPIARSNFDQGYTQEDIHIGDFATGANGYLTDGYVREGVTIPIPWYYNDFRRNSNFTRITLDLPFIGSVDISSDNLVGRDSLTVECVINAVTGIINYGIWIRDDDNVNQLLATYSGELGRQVPIASSQVNAVGALQSGVAAGASATVGFVKNQAAPEAMAGYGGGLMAIAAALGLAVGAMVAFNKQDLSILGGFGGGFGEVLFNHYYITVTSIVSRTEPTELTALYGRPCAKVVRIGTLSGYVETKGFCLNNNALSGMKKEVNEKMNAGVYIE